MATSTYAAYPSNSSDARFRAWGKALSDALAAVGLVKTDDVGQIDWATVTRPLSVTLSMGYEVWRFNDALHSSDPIFFRISYGSGAATTSPCIWVTVGHATDHAGNLIGMTSREFTIRCGGYRDANTYNCYISSDGGRINILLFANVGSGVSALVFSIERLKDTSGNPLATGVNIITGDSTARYQQLLPALGSPRAAMATYQCGAPPSGDGTYGTTVGVFPILTNIGYAGNPDLGALCYFTANIAGEITVVAQLYGTNHTYITAGAMATGSTAIGGNTTDNSLAVRYE
jgi:hypothetical protein